MFIPPEIRNNGFQHPIKNQETVVRKIFDSGGVIVIDLCDYELFITSEDDLYSRELRNLLRSWQFRIRLPPTVKVITAYRFQITGYYGETQSTPIV
jgi:hypothetical protein